VSARPVPPNRLWWLVAGFGVWCSALVVLYAVHAIGCAFAWPAVALRLILALLLLGHLVVIVWMWRDQVASSADPGFGPTGTFLRTVAIWSLIAALVTIVLTLGPALALVTCV
jgi:hypothetical protein